jgi:hypothetical protein
MPKYFVTHTLSAPQQVSFNIRVAPRPPALSQMVAQQRGIPSRSDDLVACQVVGLLGIPRTNLTDHHQEIMLVHAAVNGHTTNTNI